jgi:hypothetical protein
MRGLKKVFLPLIFFLAFIPFLKTIYDHWPSYIAPFDPKLMESYYQDSIYGRGEGGARIADELLFSYAAWNYINGGNPILLNPENPPLGKYLVGLSIKLFNNDKIFTLIFSFLSMYSIFLLGRIFLKNNWLALIPVVLFSWEQLAREQLIYAPLFEVFALTFLCLSLCFFIKALENNKYFWLSSFFIGTLWAVRPWMATVPLLASFAVYLFLVEKKLAKIISWFISLPLAATTLLLSYFKLLSEGWSLYKVLSVQKWILWYHQSRLIKFGTVWTLIYFNRWYVWWGDQPFLRMVQWNIFWPVFTTLALICSVLVFLKVFGLCQRRLKNLKVDKKITVLCLWVIFYLAFLSIGNINSRYLFYLLPYNYFLGIYLISLALSVKKKT